MSICTVFDLQTYSLTLYSTILYYSILCILLYNTATTTTTTLLLLTYTLLHLLYYSYTLQVGVVAYILLSGHEPFLGQCDAPLSLYTPMRITINRFLCIPFLGQDDQELIYANKAAIYEFHTLEWYV